MVIGNNWAHMCRIPSWPVCATSAMTLNGMITRGGREFSLRHLFPDWKSTWLKHPTHVPGSRIFSPSNAVKPSPTKYPTLGPNMATLQAIRYTRGTLELLDQRRLPTETVFLKAIDTRAAFVYIRDMVCVHWICRIDARLFVCFLARDGLGLTGFGHHVYLIMICTMKLYLQAVSFMMPVFWWYLLRVWCSRKPTQSVSEDHLYKKCAKVWGIVSACSSFEIAVKTSEDLVSSPSSRLS